MDWQNERYVRLYVRDTGDMLAIGWKGRAVFAELLRKVDRAGVLDEDSSEIIAELLRMPFEIVDPAINTLRKRGIIEVAAGAIIITNFIEAQEAKASDKLRQAESRGRRRDLARTGQLGNSVTPRDEPVTDRDEMSQPVTACHTVSQPVTPSLAKPSCTTPSLAVISSSQLSSRQGDLNPEPKSECPEPMRQPRRKSARAANADPAPQALMLARVLVDAIATRLPGSSPARAPERTAERWWKDLERLHRIDKQPWEKIRKVLEWSQSDPFWQNNILSTAKLRKQFDALEARMNSGPVFASRTPQRGLSSEELFRMSEECEE